MYLTHLQPPLTSYLNLTLLNRGARVSGLDEKVIQTELAQ